MEIKQDYKKIKKHYNALVKITKQHLFVGMINEWIVDNYYLIIERKDEVLSFLRTKKLNKYATKNVNLYKLLFSILIKNNYKIDEDILIDEIKKYQKTKNYYFSYEQIKILPLIVFILLIGKLGRICESEFLKLKHKDNIRKIIKKMRSDYNENKIVILSNYIDLKTTNERDIVYLNEQLRDLGELSNDIFKQLESFLIDNNMTLRNIIESKHLVDLNNSIIINHIFYSIREMNTVDEENLYTNISIVEGILKKDNFFANMTVETKRLYRNKIILLAKKNKINQYEYIKSIFNKDIHIGFFLFPHKETKYRFFWYLIFISLVTILLSLYLGRFLLHEYLIGAIILLIPISEIVITITNKFLLKLYPCKPIPKMDFEKGIPKDQQTMVVIITIIKNKEKVAKLFSQLESFYLSNKSDNLYFTVLGDCMGYNKEVYKEDKNIVESGLKACKELNSKYKKDIFHFVYRKRRYNEKENKWMGFERKRGALLHFNKLLLGELSKKEKKEYFNVETISKSIMNIKYVITLDSDTKLVLNTALKLTGIMAHPLNKPVIKNNKVVRGYGIIQPQIDINIDSTNKSLFTQIYAGIGGFDPYNNIYPNFYQDVFKEGSFVGKGIYDLHVFQTILEKTFPNNLILSHDLIEGNYLRCGFTSDVSLIDDFPSKFLIDASRRSRWARGDFQIIDWITSHVRNQDLKRIKNPLSLLQKWKIFDNLRRNLLDLTLLLIICVSIFSGMYTWMWFLLVFFILVLPVVSYIFEQIGTLIKRTTSIKRYNIIAFGNKAFVLRTLSVIGSMPFNAYLYLESMLKSLYRMTISKKHLLNWLTAEDAEKLVNTTLKNHFKRFWFNILISIIIITFALVSKTNIIASIIISCIFLSAPILNYILSKDIIHYKEKLDNKDEEYLKSLAKKTWFYFDALLNKKNNYLIPDNYQLNRLVKEDFKTSPTNIGFSIVSVISAFELGFIDKDKAFDLTDKIIDTVSKLPKWNGHLYNWYNINTLKVMNPNFISSVDSGNFVACLIVAKEFLNKHGNLKLAKKVENLIKKTNFSLLYTKDDVFSVGYNADEGKLEPYSYNKYISESRITSYLAIAKGDVPSRHWFNLEKVLTSFKNKKGLVSWGGTSFEYFMPLIFINTYPNTLVDESYYFAYYAQKEFMKEVNPNYPWGISESAYNELDDSENYKYKTFSTPYLKLQEEAMNRIVISPYSSILALPKFPKEVVSNIRKFSKMNMEGEYGLYESYDVSDEKPVYTFFAHHQGMILSSITNCLKENVIQKYFSNDTNNRVFDILNQEKIQIKSVIDLDIAKYKKYTYEKEPSINDIRVFHNISTLPEISVLSNSKYSTLINDRGNGFSRYRTIQMNRYRKITKQDYGMFVYIKDLSNNNVWSNTYAPINIMPKKYEVVFALDRIKFIREDNDIMTTTEIVVTKMHHAEIRKITFKNNSNKAKHLELTTYTEPIICDNPADINHRSFNNLFIDSEYDSNTNSIIMKRKLRDVDNEYYMINRLFIEKPTSNYEYETDRSNFIGRNGNASNPAALNRKLSNTFGTVIDPVISLRNTIKIDRNSEKTVFLISGFGKSKEQVLDIINTYNNPFTIEEKAFEVASIMNTVTNKMSNINGNDMRQYNTLLNYIYQTYHFINSETRNKLLESNKLNQSNLWKYGISGDRPIILVDIKNLDDLSLVKELLHAFEYFKSISIFVDLVIINSENENYAKTITKEIELEKYRMYALNSFHKIPGNIYVLEDSELTKEEKILFKTIARLVIDTDLYNSLQEYINELEKENTISRKDKNSTELSLPVSYDKNKLQFFNEYGGFTDDGKAYLIVNRDTPVAWSNVLSNPNFGSIVNNDGSGFTYAKNSQAFKITVWTNDPVLDITSEGIEIDNVNLKFNQTKIGYGYVEFTAKTSEITVLLTEFVSVNDPIKFYNLKITNNTSKNKNFKLSFYINPSLGASTEKTSRHLLGKKYINDNYVTIQNKYSMDFSDEVVFMGSTSKITNSNLEHTITKKIMTSLDVPANESETTTFLLGSTNSNIDKYIKNYTPKKINEELDLVKNNWNNKLQVIQVDTPDDSFNYIVNGWLLYQTISSRLYAKAGFHQVGGAYGFRDQLQDAMNICIVHPDMTKSQILRNAQHQFIEGDVLHWWHDDVNLGLRSRYKDDYLWLLYAVCEYISITNDKEILNIDIPFVTGDELKKEEQEKAIKFSYTDIKSSLYEHCSISLKKAMSELGENGLPLIGGGDWNDGMNKVGIKGKGTSVWLGFFLYLVVEKWLDIETNDELKDVYIKFNKNLKKDLQKTWDGNYFLRAFFDNGNTLGSYKNKECSIDLISQSFAILTDISTKAQTEKIIKSVENKLIDKDINIIKLLDPPFEKNADDPGYIMDYPKGIRENGGQYTHATAWYIMALLKENKIEEAYKYYQMINPINRSLTEKDVLTYKSEPYVISADIYSNQNFNGRGGWTWYTGSSGWYYRVAVIDILGFNKKGDILRILPKVPNKWKSFKIKYMYNNTTYLFNIIKDEKEVYIENGIESKYITLKDDNKIHEITVYFGGKDDKI